MFPVFSEKLVCTIRVRQLSRQGRYVPRNPNPHSAEGTVDLQVPQVRDDLEPFESVWLEAIGKRSKRLLEFIPVLYVKGMSQRDIEDALIEALGVEGTGRSVITEVCKETLRSGRAGS